MTINCILNENFTNAKHLIALKKIKKKRQNNSFWVREWERRNNWNKLTQSFLLTFMWRTSSKLKLWKNAIRFNAKSDFKRCCGFFSRSLKIKSRVAELTSRFSISISISLSPLSSSSTLFEFAILTLLSSKSLNWLVLR